jgi:GAF domain-containing protein
VAAGTGEAGVEMKNKEHTILLSASSVVARAARTGQTIRVDNVREAEDWLSNPLLPDTYSEMAVPIVLEGQVVGVLDVQEDEIAGLDEGDAGLLRSLANQVAVAIRNARLFSEVETALAEARSAQERYIEQAWDRTRIVNRGGQYHYARTGAPALSEASVAEIRRQALTLGAPAVIAVNGYKHQPVAGDVEETEAGPESLKHDKMALVAPIAVHNRTIGTLQLHPTGPDQHWSEDDLAVIEAVVDQLAQTAESLRLFDETRERASFESLVGQISQKLRQAPTLQILAKTTAEELGQALGISHSLVRVGITAPDSSAADAEARPGQNGKE